MYLPRRLSICKSAYHHPQTASRKTTFFVFGLCRASGRCRRDRFAHAYYLYYFVLFPDCFREHINVCVVVSISHYGKADDEAMES